MADAINAVLDRIEAQQRKLTDESPQVFDGDAHELLVATYQGRYKPSQQQLRAAYKAIEYERPRLQATAHLHDVDTFAAALDRAILRSQRAPLMIEGRAERSEQVQD